MKIRLVAIISILLPVFSLIITTGAQAICELGSKGKEDISFEKIKTMDQDCAFLELYVSTSEKNNIIKRNQCFKSILDCFKWYDDISLDKLKKTIRMEFDAPSENCKKFTCNDDYMQCSMIYNTIFQFDK